MKIAVVHNLPAGGAMRVLYEQLSRLAKKHTIDVYTLSSASDSFKPLNKIVHKYTAFRYDYPEHFPFTVISIYWKLKAVYEEMADQINKGNYDVAYVFPCFLTQAPYILRFLKIPSIYFCPEPKREFYEEIPRAGKKLTYYLTLPFRMYIKKIDFDNIHKAGFVITLSNFNKVNIKKYYGLESEVIRLGVNTEIFYPVKVKKENYVLTVGNFNLLKGQDFIIRSISLIAEKIRPKLVIAGFGGTDREHLESLAKELKVRLSWYDSPEDNELNLLYNKAKLFVFTPWNEPFGLVVLEASATGLKLLAVKEGGVPEVVTDKIMGSLLNRREMLFSRSIEKEMKTKEDKEIGMLRRNYVRNNWSWDKSVAELDTVFNKVLKSN